MLHLVAEKCMNNNDVPYCSVTFHTAMQDAGWLNIDHCSSAGRDRWGCVFLF